MSYIFQSFSLGVGLAMDASAVSMTDGLTMPSMKKGKMLFIALTYSVFQTLMPLIGYFAGSIFVDFLSKFVPYIALVLLGFIGVNMLIEGLKKEDIEVVKLETLQLKTILLQGIATSIDALSVGITMITYSIVEMLISVSIIGGVTFILCFISIIIGKKFGNSLGKKAKLVGGIILTIIGFEIFIKGVFF